MALNSTAQRHSAPRAEGLGNDHVKRPADDDTQRLGDAGVAEGSRAAKQLGDEAARIIAQGSKSFAAAARLFAPNTRRSALLLYAWCRHCDDVIDGQELGWRVDAGNPAPDRADATAALAELKRETLRACAGEPVNHPAFAALREVTARHAIPAALPLAHLDGFAMDAAGARYRVFDDTLRYCYYVAGVVGLMMAQVMGVRDEPTLDRACDLGIAFQLTNIARDIVDDARSDRCYLPEAWLEETSLPTEPAALAAPQWRPALAVLAARLVREAEPYYASARIGIAALPLRSAWAIATARRVYRAIGIDVVACGEHAWDRRVSTSRSRKALLLAAGLSDALTRAAVSPLPRSPLLWQRPTVASSPLPSSLSSAPHATRAADF